MLTASLLSPEEYAWEDVRPTGLLWAKAQPQVPQIPQEGWASSVGPSKGPGPVEEPTGQGWAAANLARTAKIMTEAVGEIRAFLLGSRGCGPDGQGRHR